MDGPIRDLAINVVGGLITAWLLFVVSRSWGTGSRNNDVVFRDDHSSFVLPAPIPGPVFRRPVTPAVLSALLGGVLLFSLDFIFPPFGLAKLRDGSDLAFFFRNEPAARLRTEADSFGVRHKIEAAETLRRLEEDVFRLMQRAADEEKQLRDSGQIAAADQVVALASAHARLLQEQAKTDLQSSSKIAAEQTGRLLSEASTEYIKTAGVWQRLDTALQSFTNWTARFLCLSMMATFVLRQWRLPLPTFKTGAALGLAALFLGILRLFLPIGVFDLVVPLFAAAVIFAGVKEQQNSTGLIRNGLALLFERSGRALIIIAAVFATALLGAILGFYIPTALSHITSSVGFANGSEFFTSLLGAIFALEVGHCLSVISFVSVLAGPADHSMVQSNDPSQS